MRVLTAAQMREVDRLTAERAGVSSLTLMENAGSAVAAGLRDRFFDLLSRRVAVLCGKGNNGGDGFVVARKLFEAGLRPDVSLFAAPASVQGDAAANLKRWRDTGGPLRVIENPADWEKARAEVLQAQILVDALLGTGLHGPAEGLIAKVIEDVNGVADNCFVLAVDIPSGLSADSGEVPGAAVQAECTITFTAPKLGALLAPASDRVGRLLVRSIGSPAGLLEEVAGAGASELRWSEPAEFAALPLRRRPGAHKGDFGHALIVAGSLGKTGAAVLAASGALRAGVGLVTVATPDAVLPIVASQLPEMMTEPLASTDAGSASIRSFEYGRWERLFVGKNILAVGPGLSTQSETQDFIRSVVTGTALPLVLDADGLNAFAGRPGLLAKRKAPLAVTPHPGEMARLLGTTSGDVQGRRLEVALDATKAWNAYVVLKGHRTITAAPGGRVFFNSTGNPGMAKGGTGDVLTGILAGLAAQFGTREWERVLALGVYLHGLAGDLAAEKQGQASLIASDLIAALPAAFAQLFRELSIG